jgi:hypothetical protein
MQLRQAFNQRQKESGHLAERQGLPSLQPNSQSLPAQRSAVLFSDHNCRTRTKPYDSAWANKRPTINLLKGSRQIKQWRWVLIAGKLDQCNRSIAVARILASVSSIQSGDVASARYFIALATITDHQARWGFLSHADLQLRSPCCLPL